MVEVFDYTCPYMAAYGAKLAAHNALNGDGVVYDNTAMPWVVFTDPQVAGVKGLKLAAQTFDKDVAMLSCCAG